MPLEPVADKWRAFGWQSWEIDGHDYEQIVDAITRAKASPGRPAMIVANTIKGRGVSFMENEVSWHGTAPDHREYTRAIQELQ